MIYEKPEVDVILYENVDIITLSGNSPVAPVDPTDPVNPPIPSGCQTAISIIRECKSYANLRGI